MGRTRLFSDAEFRAAIRQERSVERAAGVLGCSVAAIYKHCKTLDVEPPKRTRHVEVATKVATQYRGHRTIKLVANITGFSRSSVRYHLMTWIAHVWITPKHPAYKYAVPLTVREIKLVNMLLEDEKMFDKPDDMADACGLPKFEAREFVERSFERMKKLKQEKRDKKQPPRAVQGRRAFVPVPQPRKKVVA